MCVKLCAIGFLCVCSGHIPHHRCCSVYVISRVQIAFHITLLNSTPGTLNVFTSCIIPSHHIKTFYITPPFMSHHSTPHHHCTTFHITYSTSHLTVNVATHLTSDHHILHLRSHYTAVCFGTPPFHTTSQSTTRSTSHSHSPHLTPFHSHNYSTPPPHSTSQHNSHHNTFHIALHHHIVHCNFTHFALCNIPHTRTPHSTPRYISHHILHFNHTMSQIATFHIAPHFTYIDIDHSTTSRRTIYITPTFHLAPCHANRHVQM